MPGIKLKTVGIKPLQKKLERAMYKIKQPTDFMHIATAKSFREVINHFSTERGPSGRWKPLKSETIKRRRQKSSKPLQDTGRLRGSLRHRVVNRGKEGVIFTNLKYAPTHQYGYKKIPARPYVWLPKEFVKKLAAQFAKFIRRDFK